MALGDNDQLRDSLIAAGLGVSGLASQAFQRRNIEETRNLNQALGTARASLQEQLRNREAGVFQQAAQQQEQALTAVSEVNKLKDELRAAITNRTRRRALKPLAQQLFGPNVDSAMLNVKGQLTPVVYRGFTSHQITPSSFAPLRETQIKTGSGRGRPDPFGASALTPQQMLLSPIDKISPAQQASLLSDSLREMQLRASLSNPNRTTKDIQVYQALVAAKEAGVGLQVAQKLQQGGYPIFKTSGSSQGATYRAFKK